MYPYNWYWRAADGRVYSSASQSLVSANDAAFVAWQSGGNVETAWPVDSTGAQTSAALQDVVAPFGLFADLKAYAASVRYAKEIAGASVNGIAYPSDRETQAKMTSAALMAQINPAVSFRWKTASGSFVTLDAAGILAVASAIGAYVQTAFAAEATVVTGIDAGTVTTRAQVDAAFA